MTTSEALSANATHLQKVDLQSFIIRRDRLTAADRTQMLNLHTRYFDNVQSVRFHTDLEEKDWVILVRAGPKLAGFSTQKLITLGQAGREHRFLFSGDTIVDRAYWREQHLAGCFGHLMLRQIREHGENNLYWFLISKGYRTYRFLPVFFHRFYPRPDAQSPTGLAAALQLVARAKYGSAYDEKSGLIIPDEHADRLRPEFCEVPESKQADPHVEFFLKHNPRYQAGYELACIAEIRQDNLNRLAWRVIEQTSPIWIA